MPLASWRPMARFTLFLALCIVAGAGSSARASASGSPAAADADSCTSCHAALPPRLRDPVRLLKAGDVHAAAGVSCAACHGGDPKSQTAQEAHRDTFPVSAGDADTIATMC